MELENQTNYPAMLFRGCISEDRLAAAVILRVTFSSAKGKLTVAEDQVWKVSAAPWDSVYGPMDSDEVFYRGGVDLMIFGSARAAGGRPVTTMKLKVSVGSFAHEISIIGDRVWKEQDSTAVPSEPRPFSEIPLDLAHAFGGKDEWDKLEIPFPSNPDGRGYAMNPKSAVGKPLPNIEDPRHPIRSWEDQPEPVGVAATTMAFGPRLQRGVEIDQKLGVIKEIKPRLFNSAYPDLIAPSVQAGDRVCVEGIRHDGPLTIEVPACPAALKLAFDDKVFHPTLAVDQIGIEPDADRVFITYRHPFRYRLIPEQLRSCALTMVG